VLRTSEKQIRLRETQKLADPTDPDPEHCSKENHQGYTELLKVKNQEILNFFIFFFFRVSGLETVGCTLIICFVFFRGRQMASDAVESLLLLGQQPVVSSSFSASSSSSLSSSVIFSNILMMCFVFSRGRQMASDAVESLLLLGQQPVVSSSSFSASPSSSSTSSLFSDVIFFLIF
jgi:hypothetical protein